MESLRELYRIGYGPSSSHTMGPRAAAERYIREHSDIKSVRVELYGSLAATGKGHLTDKAIVDVFNANGIKNEIVWYPDSFKPFHPNAVTFISDEATDTYYSVGGGKIVKEGEDNLVDDKVYPDLVLGDMEKMLHYCDYHGYQMWEVAIEYEGESILEYAGEV